MLNKYIKINRNEYIYFKLTPSTSCRNHKSDAFVELINKIYLDFNKLISVDADNEKMVTISFLPKVSYYMYMEKGKEVCFYFIVPESYKLQFQDRIINTWKGVTSTRISKYDVPQFSDECTKYALIYTKEDGLSLETNKANNNLLSSNLNVLDVLEEGDRLGIFYNFQAVSEYGHKTFINKYNDTIGKIKDFKPVEKNKNSPIYVYKMVFTMFLEAIEGIFKGMSLETNKDNSIMNTEKILTRVLGKTQQNLSNSTDKKATSQLVRTQIVLLSESDDKIREKLNAKTLANSYNCVSGDNSLKRIDLNKNSIGIKRRFSFNMEKFNVVDSKYTNIMSDLEAGSNLINLPGDTILREVKSIERVDTREVPVHEELREGIVPLGPVTYRGKDFVSYLNEHGELKYLPIAILTKQGGGKSSWFENVGVHLMRYYRMMKDVSPVKRESLFIIDFIKNCEMSYNIMYNIDQKDIVKIDLSNPNDIQGIGFNEFKPKSSKPEDIIDCASLQSQEMMVLIDTINPNADPLSPKMRRYLKSAFEICYIHEGKSLRDAIRILEYKDVRHQYIKDIPECMKEEFDDEVRTLLELDDDSDGTKLNLIQGIIDRVYTLKEHSILKRMYKAPITNNVDLAKSMQDGKAIFILMPQDKFKTPMVKNILVTYFISKMFLASEQRAGAVGTKNLTRCTCIVDEIVQAKGCFNTLNEILTQLRKFRLRPIFSAHNWEQIKPIEHNFVDSGLSIILPQGSNKNNFKKYAKEFARDEFDEDDLLNLKEFQSINLIQTKKGYTSFISTFPKPVDGKIEDRDDIDFEEFKDIINKRVEAVNPKVVKTEEHIENIIRVDFNKEHINVNIDSKEEIQNNINEFEILDEDVIIIDNKDIEVLSGYNAKERLVVREKYDIVRMYDKIE